MTKADLLAIMRLLSALESWGFAQGTRLPDYLHESLGDALEKIESEILKEVQP